MGIAITCSGCGKSGSVSEAVAGKRVKCPSCGAATQIPALRPITKPAAKICTGCGADVAGQKRTKDQHGRYYCEPCWTAKTAGRGEVVAQSPVVGAGRERSAQRMMPLETLQAIDEVGETATCPACNASVAASEMTTDDYGDPICAACHHERNSLFDVAPGMVQAAPVAVAPPVAAAPARTVARPAVKAKPQAAKKSSGTATGGRSGVGQMVIGGLICVAGSSATIAGYNAASQGGNGGRYTIFGGAIIFGAIGFFRGLFSMMSGG